MTPVEFPEQTVVIAKDQPQYLPLPAHVYAGDQDRRVTFCWKLTPDELVELNRTGLLWHTVMTFGDPLQPQMLSVDKPVMRSIQDPTAGG
jgi:hypothetical protein